VRDSQGMKDRLSSKAKSTKNLEALIERSRELRETSKKLDQEAAQLEEVIKGLRKGLRSKPRV